TIRTGSQRPFAVHDFPMGFYEVGESSTARDPQFVGSLAPWALRAEKRLSESIWWNDRFYLKMVRKGAVPKPSYDDEGSKRPRKMPKKSDEDEGPSDPRGSLMIMPPKPMSKACMRKIIRDQFATSMNEFMANMNNGAG
nr:hypothetical protein [Tanacetum cinerariifolium]